MKVYSEYKMASQTFHIWVVEERSGSTHIARMEGGEMVFDRVPAAAETPPTFEWHASLVDAFADALSKNGSLDARLLKAFDREQDRVDRLIGMLGGPS